MNGNRGPPIKVEKDDTSNKRASHNASSATAVNCQEERQVPSNNERDRSTDSTEMDSPSPQQLVHAGELSYQEITIKIFTEATNEKSKTSPRFFFEPTVVLDPKSVIIQSQELFKEDVVRFSIQMWNQDIRSKVLDRLRLKNSEVDEDDVRVMPYEDVQLVGKPGSFHQSVKIMEEASPYHRLNEKLDFFLLCDSPATAKGLANNLRHYPEFVVRKWQLALECRGLALKPSVTAVKAVINRPVFKLSVSTLPSVVLSQGNK